MRSAFFKKVLLTSVVAGAFAGAAQAQFTFSHIGGGATGSIITNDLPTGSYTMEGGGNDIWSASDEFDFAHFTQTGDFDVKVRVESLEFTATWTKAGLMARENLNGNSRMAFNRVTPAAGANDSRYAYRTGVTSGAQGEHEDGSGSPGYPDAWLRLKRAGAVITAYRGSDGSNWVSQGAQNTATWEGGALPAGLELGFAVSRHSGTEPLATAEFRQYGKTAPTIASQPGNKLVSVGQTATFSVSVESTFVGQVAYQWYEDGSLLPGATASSYSKVNPVLADSGKGYSVLVSNTLNGVTTLSSTGVLTVMANPQVVTVSTRNDPSDVYVTYSKPMDSTTALTTGNYSIPGLTITGASFFGSGTNVVRLAVTGLAIQTAYTLTVSNVNDQDGSPNTIVPNPTSVAFTHAASISTGANGLTVNRYDGSGDFNTILGKIASCVAPTRSSSTINVAMEYTTSESATIAGGNTFGDPNLDNYGAWVYGQFVPPVTGNYRFGLSSDDLSQLYLSTDDSPANKVLLTSQGAWNCYRRYVSPGCGEAGVPPLSGLIPLQAGRTYYLETIVAEGGGGDHVSVAVQKPGDPAITDGQLPISRDLFATNYTFGCPPTVFFNNLGPVTIATQPQSQTIVANTSARFHVRADGSPGYTYQWYSNSVAVAGATAQNFSFVAQLGASNSTYYVVVANEFSSVTSAVATLSVFSAPILLSASSRNDPNGVYVTFSRQMNATALNTANYSVTNSTGAVAISSASFFPGSGSNVVRLQVATLTLGGTYTATARDVQDFGGTVIAPNPSSAIFTHGTGINAAAGLTVKIYNGANTLALIHNAVATCAVPTFQSSTANVAFEYTTSERSAVVDGNTFSQGNTENYGTWIYGEFVPPTTGNYQFALSCDDFGELYLSTDATPANKVLLTSQGGWNGYRGYISGNGNTPPPLPAPISLVAGRRYYTEVFVQEGGGGDHVSVTVRKPGDAPIVDNQLPIPRSMFATNFSSGCPPTAFFSTLGPVTTTGPVDQTVAERFNATFLTLLDGTPPYGVQWYSNGVLVTNATGTSFTVVKALRAASGSQFYAVVTNGFSSTTTSVATLTVINDTNSPTLFSAYGSGTFSNATVVFSEPVDSTTGLEISNYSITNSAGAPLAILSLSQRDGSNIVLRTATQTPGERYTVVVNNVLDQAGVGNVIAANSTISFSGWVFSPGFALMEVYPTGGGNTVANLTGHPSYPFYPREKYYISSATSRAAYPNDSHEGYGGRISGWFVPQGSSNFQFSIINDDDAALRGSLSEYPADAQTVGTQPCCSGTFRNVGPALPLVASNRYYFEVLWKEGTGGDYAGVSIDGVNPFPATLMGSYANPDAISLVITQQPQSQTKAENQQATFTVGVSLTSFDGAVRTLLYQWKSNGVDIAGANSSSYTTPLLTQAADNGSVYSVLVRAAGGTLLSSNATLNVIIDTISPTLKRIHEDGTLTKLYLQWSEPVDPGAAGEAGNYLIFDPSANQLNVLSVDYRGSNVVLTTDPMVPGTSYDIEIDFQTDIGGNPSDPDPVLTNILAGTIAAPLTKFEAYLGLPGGSTVASFTALPQYPNSSSFSFYTNVVNWPQSAPNIENYAMRFTGLFVAPETGLYRFNPAHDDPVRLRISSDENPANANANVFNANCCTGLGDGPTLDVQMDAGDWRYYELIVVENGGGDYAGFQVQIPSGPTYSPADRFIAVFAVNAGIAVQPQDQFIEENHSATFSVTVTNAGAGAGYQWQADSGTGFANIPGATAASYSTGYVPITADGTQYRVIVTVPGRTLTSAAATLHVTTDTGKPLALRARGLRSLSAMKIVFNEAMDLTTATTAGNYSLTDSNSNPVATGTPTLSADLTTVTVPTDPQAEGAFYTVHVQNVTDVKGNVMDPTNITFQTWVTGLGFAIRDFYYNVPEPANALANLTNDSRYPNNPSFVDHFSQYAVNPALGDSGRETYGARVSGYIIPSATGDYKFKLTSDDGGALRLSTNASPSNMVSVIFADGDCGGCGGPVSSNTYHLVAGQRYYTEAIFEEGTGGDYLVIAWTTTPADGASYTPIVGINLASLADPMGASVTITQQPASRVFVPNPGTDNLLLQDFNSNDGGFTVNTPLAYSGPWTYSAGSWRENGQDPNNGQANTSFLNSPTVTVGVSGHLVLSFSHRYNFEYDGRRWDGGAVRISVNGGAFTAVPAAALLQNGYGGFTVDGGSQSDLAGKPAFTSQSPNFGSAFIVSIVDLGAFNPSDTVRVQFMAASDSNTQLGTPDWEIDSVQISQGNDPQNLSVTFSVGASAVNEESGANPPRVYQWYRNNGLGWNVILGANSPSYTLVPQPADSGAQFRAVIYIPGANATSASATLTVGQPSLSITRSGSQTTISWTGPFCLQETSDLNPPPVWVSSSVANGVPFTPGPGNKFYRLINCP